MQTKALLMVVLIGGIFQGVASVRAETAELSLNPLFTDHMVLQEGVPVPVWGTAAPDAEVTVKLGEEEGVAKADASGKWRVELEARERSLDPLELAVTSAESSVTLNDVLIGNVWVCSGQSNMDWPLEKSDGFEAARKDAAEQPIRLLYVHRNQSMRPVDVLDAGARDGWFVPDADNVSTFSAVGYHFGKSLGKDYGPIGLIHTAWGGTPAEAWTPLSDLKEVAGFEDWTQLLEANADEESMKQHYQGRLTEWSTMFNELDPGMNGLEPAWAQPDLDTSDWTARTVPSVWEGEHQEFDGAIWYRKDVEVPAEATQSEATLQLACIDDMDETYVNGKLVGSTEKSHSVRKYNIPAGALQPGKNTIAIRVLDVMGAGGTCGNAEDFFIQTGGPSSQKIPLGGEWLTKAGGDLAKASGPRPMDPTQGVKPTSLYNAMVHPLTGFPVKGVIWYQGESNASRAAQYRELFPAMITAWRNAWDQPEMPFLYVQLAAYMERDKEGPGESQWAELRDAQTNTLDVVEHVGMASAIDVGDEKDIHPRDKKTVGERLAAAARVVAHEEDGHPTGPVMDMLVFDGNKATVVFKYADGLKAKGDKITGFALAGKDRKFHWAKARIVGVRVVVESEDVDEPVAVRYGWSNYPQINLYNKAGLPASPFRSDKWENEKP